MIINVVDAGCGIGKTTALINKINNDTSNQKYLYITPFLDEVDRIKGACPNKNFKTPECRGTKLQDIIRLFEYGHNIVTTHALFKRLNSDVLNAARLHDYILVMDEVADTIEELMITKPDLKLITNQYVAVHPRTHILEWTDDKYSGKFSEYMTMIKMNSVFAHTDNKQNENPKVVSLMWMFPYTIFSAFKEVYILTYMFEGQIQKKYFDYFQAEYRNWYIKDFQLTPEKQTYDYSKQKSMIEVYNQHNLNAIGDDYYALSLSWFNKHKKTEEVKKLSNNMYNFFRHHANVAVDLTLWTTFKEYKKSIRSHGYFSSFAAINARATNQYKNRTAVAYIGNRFLKPTIKNFFHFNNIATSKEFEDKYALSELIQFVYRSAIRDGKPIKVYIPSKRMRKLFQDWLKKPNN